MELKQLTFISINKQNSNLTLAPVCFVTYNFSRVENTTLGLHTQLLLARQKHSAVATNLRRSKQRCIDRKRRRHRWKVSKLSTMSDANKPCGHHKMPPPPASAPFQIGGPRTCRWCESWYSICAPSFKFVGLPVRKTFGHGFKQPGDFSTYKWSNWSSCHGLPFCEFSACHAQARDRLVDRRRPLSLNALTVWWRGHNKLKDRT